MCRTSTSWWPRWMAIRWSFRFCWINPRKTGGILWGICSIFWDGDSVINLFCSIFWGSLSKFSSYCRFKYICYYLWVLLKAIILGDARLMKYQPDSWFGDLWWSRGPGMVPHFEPCRNWVFFLVFFSIKRDGDVRGSWDLHCTMFICFKFTLHASKQDQEEQLYQI